MPRPYLLLLVVVALLVRSAEAQPAITHTTPGAVQPGKTVELHLHGDKLVHPLRVWTSFPAKVEVLSTDADKKNVKLLRCKVTVAANAGLGVGGIFVGNSNNSSDVIFVPIDDMPSVADNGKNHSPATAQELKLPIAVDGVSDGSVLDYYKFTGKAGERLSVEVLATRIGSAFDPVIRLLDATGVELMLADDAAGLGADCRFSIKLPADGVYTLMLQDNKYAAGGRYRMRVGDFPNVATPYPLGGRVGSTRQFAFAGYDAKDAAPLLASISRHSPFDARVSLAARSKGGKASAILSLIASDVPEIVEKEGNDDIKSATAVTLPCAVSGMFQKSNDADHYQYMARKGQRLTFRAISQSVGSPAYVAMRILAADGKQIAETKVSAAQELTLAQTVAADGVYILRVEDLLRRGGEEFSYRVSIEEGGSFRLNLKNDKATTNRFKIATNGAIALNLDCVRTGYDGPIKLTASMHGSATQPAVPLTIRQDTIAAKAKTHQVMLCVPPKAAGQVYSIRLVGHAADGSSQAVGFVHTDAWLKTKRPAMGTPPDWHDGLLQFVAGGNVTPFYVNTIQPSQVYFPSQLNTATFKLTVTAKNKDFKSALKVIVEGLPSTVKYAVKQDKTNYTITLTGPAEALAEQNKLRVVTLGDLKGTWLRSEHEVAVRVVQPLQVKVEPAGPLTVNNKQRVKLTVVRAPGSVAQPVTLKLTKLPKEVSGAASYTIPAEQDQIEIELLATAKAVAATADLSVSATTKYLGKDISATGSGSLVVRK